MTTDEVAKKIVDAILKDLSDRRGLRGAWAMTDPDIQREIRAQWEALTNDTIEKLCGYVKEQR